MTKFFLALLLLFPASVYCQYSTSLVVPALTSSARRSSGSLITFDRTVLVQASGAANGDFCLYINTRTGDIGVRFVDGPSSCPMNINDEKFRLTVIRPTGVVQNFVTTKQNGVLKHFVSTGNTEIVRVSFPPMQNAELGRLESTAWTRRHEITARGYRANESAPTFFLYGRTFPRDVTTQDFLGYSGIGYLKTNRGVYMVIRADMGGTEYRAARWSDSPSQLNQDSFKQIETILTDKLLPSLQREEDRLRNETFSGECSGEERELNRLKLADVEARRRTEAASRRGNIYESESTRRAYGELLMPNLEVLNQEIEVNACKAEVRRSRTRSERTRTDLSQRIACYRNQQLELSRLRMELDAIDARYPNEPGRAYAEKTRRLTDLMSLGSGCR